MEPLLGRCQGLPLPLLLGTVLAWLDRAENPRASKSSSTGKSRDDIRKNFPGGPTCSIGGGGNKDIKRELGGHAWLIQVLALTPHLAPRFWLLRG